MYLEGERAALKKKRSGHMQSVAFVWVIGLEMLPHINSECSFINQSPTHCTFPFVYLKCILSMNYVCRITIVFSGIATEIFVGAVIETFCFQERCSWSKRMNRFPTVHCGAHSNWVLHCCIGPVFPFLEAAVGSVIAEEIQNIQVKQQESRVA